MARFAEGYYWTQPSKYTCNQGLGTTTLRGKICKKLLLNATKWVYMQPGDRNYHLIWQDLQKVTTERNQVSIHAARG